MSGIMQLLLGRAAGGLTSVEYLVVGGGGGGRSGGLYEDPYFGRGVFIFAGGGGAGGYRTGTFSVSAGTSYPITVGAGGPTESNGSASYLGSGGASIESIGGATTGGAQGGSGGGGLIAVLTVAPDQNYVNGVDFTTAAGTGTSGQGNNGGTYGGTPFQNLDGSFFGGGGGGAAEAGNTDGNGHGGDGSTSSISGSSETYAGGGGGGFYDGYGPGIGGTGGGGDGGAGATTGSAGSANTGGGGGAGGCPAAQSPAPGGVNGASGGSGIVIIRYPDSFPLAASTTGSPTVTTTGGYRIYKFTGSGSITW